MPEAGEEKLDGPAWRKHCARRQLHASNGLAPDDNSARIAALASHLPLASPTPSPSLPPAGSLQIPDQADIASPDRPAEIASTPTPTLPAASNSLVTSQTVSNQPVTNPPEPRPLELHGVRTPDSRLFKLRGWFAGHEATILLDSGASDTFIDTEFAARCGYELGASDRTIRLADGSITRAAGCMTATCSLAAAKGTPIPFEASFTATALESYDAILGMTWLAAHDPLIGWRDRSITLRTPGRPHRLIRPIECLSDSSSIAQIATITCKGLYKAHRRGEVEELYLVRLEATGNQLVTSSSVSNQPVTNSSASNQRVTSGSRGSAASEAGPPGTDNEDVQRLLKEFSDVFPAALPNAAETPNRGVEHRIELKPGSSIPHPRPLRHQSAKDAAAMRDYVQAGVESGQIQVSQSPYGSMAIVVWKKDGTPRVVIDYRGLNDVTVKNKYPLPLMDELFDRVHGANFFTLIDLRTGFHQIKIHPDDREKTAFRTRFGSFEYTVLPMGLCNAPGTFMQLMNDTFHDVLDRFVLVFLDDILIFSKTREEHIKHVREVLTRLRKQKLYAKLSKCEFFQEQVTFLGHQIGANGLSVSQDKIDAVRDWPAPKNDTEVRSFLGFANFYRRFVKNYSLLALPISELTKNDVKFAWGDAQHKAFTALKQALCSAPVLLIPDPALPYTLNCDACNYAVGATLQQDQGNGLQPIAYRSRKLTPAEINYDVREKEFLAFVDACSHWRQYLHSDEPFKFMTDHDSLKYHRTMPNLTGRLARWVEKLAEFNYTVEHIAGVKNVVADALSRRPDYKDSARDSSLASQLRISNQPDRLVTNSNQPGRLVTSELLAAARLRRPDLTPAEAERERRRNRAAAEESAPPAPDRPRPNAKGTIVMPSQRCTARTKKGEPCRQRTAKGQFCWCHLSSERGLRIKPSTVPGAGLGLFAAKSLPARHTIDYTGDRVPLADEDDGGVYFLQTRSNEAIDAARTNAGEGRWVNDPRGTAKRANAVFTLYTPPGGQRRAGLRTTRPVASGEEILVKYGSDYWRFSRQKTKRLRRDRLVTISNQLVTNSNSQLLTMSEVVVTSSLTEAILKATKADVDYARRCEQPVPGYTVMRAHNGDLLFEGDRLVVPSDAELRTRILAECHDSTTGCHFGRDKTLDAVKRRFAWDGMSTDVDRYVASCDSCQRNKPGQSLTPGPLMPLPLPEHPCMAWTTDAVTGLPKTKRGNDAIQVYVERLCKLKHFVASKKSDGAVELAASFVKTVVRAHGVPETLVSDRDPRFTAHFYAELTKLLGVTLAMSTARHPQSDGQSEREIKTLITALRAFCNEHQNDWDDYLDMVELGFNSTTQASTQSSPFELLYGMKPRLPVDVALAPIAPKNPAAIDRANRMQAALRVARSHLLDAQQRQVKNADRHRRHAAFAVGDAALLSTEGLQLRNGSNKLCSRFIGPFEVIEVVNANAYKLKLPPQLQALHPTFNIDKLKPYRDGRRLFPSRPLQFDRPPPEIQADSNGDAVFEVERIVAQRKRGRVAEYLVAWKGYPPEENTWEKRSALSSAVDALAEFEHNQRVEASED